MAHHGDTGRFNLLARKLAMFHGLQADITERDSRAARRGAAQAAFLPLAEFNSLGGEHYCSTSLSRISPLYTHTLMPMRP